MKQITRIKTITFDVCFPSDPGFYVDIVTDSEWHHAWLYHEDYGTKMYLFGLLKKECKSRQEFIDVVQSNLFNQDYVNDYKDRFMN